MRELLEKRLKELQAKKQQLGIAITDGRRKVAEDERSYLVVAGAIGEVEILIEIISREENTSTGA